MIVKCEQCQTRFKIPDDKVTDKGVKVRCTKCSHTFRVTRDMAQPATATVPALGAPAAGDPFARFGAPAPPPDAEVTRPGVFALGVEATKGPSRSASAPPPPAYPAAPAYPTAPPRPADVPFDFGSLSPPGTTSPHVPVFTPPAAPAVASPFDFAAIARPTAAPAPPPPGAPSAFDFSNFAAPAAQPLPPPPPPPRPITGTTPALPAFDFSQVAPPAPSGGAFDMGGLQAQSSAPMDDGGHHGAAFPGAGSGGSADGFFAGADDAGPGASAVDGAAARAMFDMPQPPAAPAALLDLPAPEVETNAAGYNIERVAVARVSNPQQPVAVPAPPPEEAPRRGRAVGIIVNVMIAAVLVLGLVVVGSAYLNEGKFSTDALSLEGLKNTFAPSVDFVANDVSNGLYETRAGRSVFFVRGEVMNRSEASVKVVVKAEIVEDGKVVRFGESWAGEPATPEEIFLIDNTESLEALNRKVEKRSLVVPAGAAAAFVVPFTEYPPDLKGFRVRVSARAVAVSPTAANP
ncbi:MAG: zinc-ribbon domain-containing protein [Archangium sp.]|nr:zinc-ribbon domain-containing protein [Archangium sp.]